MTTRIYAFPPVPAELTGWTRVAPVRRSTGFNDQRGFPTSAGPARIRATVVAVARNCRHDAAGMVESLIHLLDGGLHLVRLWSPPPNPRRLSAALRAGGQALTGAPLVHRDPDDDDVTHLDPEDDQVVHYHPTISPGTATTLGGFPAVALSGLPPGRLIVRAYEVLRSFDGVTDQGTARALRSVWSAADGTAVVPLHTDLPSGAISIGDRESRVFELDGDPPFQEQPYAGDWSARFDFIEVLPAHIPSGAQEVNPWT